MPISDKVMQCSYVSTLDAKTYTNQVHFEQDGGDGGIFTLATHGALAAAACIELWSDNLAPIQSQSCALVEVQLRMLGETIRLPTIPPALPGTPQQIFFNPSEELAYTTGLPVLGSITGDYLPGFNAFRARKITASPGRRGRGHNSFPGVPETGTVGNMMGTGDWSTWQTNAPVLLGTPINFTDGVTAVKLNPCVLSLTAARYAGLVGQPSVLFSRRIITVIPNRLIGTMVR